MALKPHHTLSSLFRKPKEAINFEQKRSLVYKISCRDCNTVYVGETGRSVRTRKREHADAVKTSNTKKSALSQHVMDFDHRIDWDNVKILKSESRAYRRRVAESLIAMMVQIFRLFIVCLSPINNVLCFSQHFSLGHSCICDVTMFLLLRDCLPC